MVTDSKLSFRLARGWSRIGRPTEAIGVIGFKMRGNAPQNFSLSGEFTELKNVLYDNQYGEAVSNIEEVPDEVIAGIQAPNSKIP